MSEFPRYFPYENIRLSQKELMDDIKNALQQQQILLAHAPTGLGKTVSALAIALDIALEQRKMIFFLTNRHTQHHLAVETLKQIKQKHNLNITVVDLIGKKNMCSQPIATLFGNDFTEYCKSVVEKGECEFYNNVRNKHALTVHAKKQLLELKQQGPLHTEELITRMKDEHFCSYEISLALAKDATIIVGDYYYLFHPRVQTTILNKLEKDLEDLIVIVDEGHNLPSRISELLSATLSSHLIKNAVVEAKKYNYHGLIVWLQELMSIITYFALEFENIPQKEIKIEKQDFITKVQNVIDYQTFIDQLEIAADEIRKQQQRSFLGSIASFLEQWKTEKEGYVRYLSEKQTRFGLMLTLNCSCLDPSILTKDIFSRIYAGVMMSGTLKPMFMYKDILGITRAVEKEYPSPFPPENKLTLILPETTTKYTFRNETMFQKIAARCSELVSVIPGNVALFFPSYDLRDRIAPFLSTTKRLFWEKSEMSKEEKELFLNRFKLEKENGGLLLAVAGANFAEGVDFIGDVLTGVVVVGLPLAKPDLKTKETISYYEKNYQRGWDYGYIYPALNKCFQSAGRCIRSETDRGVIIYLDERFTWQNYFCCFPREGVIVTRNALPQLTQFFNQFPTAKEQSYHLIN